MTYSFLLLCRESLQSSAEEIRIKKLSDDLFVWLIA